MRSICVQELWELLRSHQHSSDQMKILKDYIVQTTARLTASVTYRYPS